MSGKVSDLPIRSKRALFTQKKLDRGGGVGGGVAVADGVRALALNGDRIFPAGFDSHCGRL